MDNYKELIDLGIKAIKAKEWRWMSGMKTLTGSRVLDIEKDTGMILAYNDREPLSRLDIATTTPDLSDPATLGCLLALVRRIHGKDIYTSERGGRWLVAYDRIEDVAYVISRGPTEATVLLAALETPKLKEENEYAL